MMNPIRRAFRWARTNWKYTLFGLGVLAVIGLTVFVVGVTVWEYTNSTKFCGTTCHTMPPEYVAYQQSPHARVACVDCHLGQESVLQALPRKAKEVRHVVYALTQDYEIPIYVRNLRPARDTCEQCHDPEKSSLDSLKRVTTYAADEKNTPISTWLTLKTGGGAKRAGLGRGIHWHTVNEVWYLANDHLKQEIPYIKEVRDDGSTIEYFDLESGITPDQVAQRSAELQRMDCIDCHNRVSHTFNSPNAAVDEALADGRIDRSLPFIKDQGVKALTGRTGTLEQARAEIAKVEDWYKETQPDIYAEKQAVIQSAVAELQAMFTDMYFPDMQVGADTHPSNLGHKDFPGCFRCHDGKHTSAAGQTIRLECNVCHTIPRLSGAGLPTPTISVEPSNEPESHKDSNWLARHRQEFDETCAGCHSTFNRGGSDNTSFCSNAACHGVKWQFAGLDAPGVRALLPPPSEVEVAPAPRSDNEGEGVFVPFIPHPLNEERIGQCRTCHGPDGLQPFPDSHKEFELSVCTDCHKMAPNLPQQGAAGSGS